MRRKELSHNPRSVQGDLGWPIPKCWFSQAYRSGEAKRLLRAAPHWISLIVTKELGTPAIATRYLLIFGWDSDLFWSKATKATRPQNTQVFFSMERGHFCFSWCCLVLVLCLQGWNNGCAGYGGFRLGCHGCVGFQNGHLHTLSHLSLSFIYITTNKSDGFAKWIRLVWFQNVSVLVSIALVPSEVPKVYRTIALQTIGLFFEPVPTVFFCFRWLAGEAKEAQRGGASVNSWTHRLTVFVWKKPLR